ncbi:hypothetical protein BROUX41_000950 [Berkeleyomyces rouxiae]|uniref:uncharacterized protein n=1 Tax=Berkeleyomyces rouxiae TaxID=2035830 RepID=UPI003B7DD6BF
MDYACRLNTVEKRFDVAVVGASITGCIAAMAFARQGRSVLLFDHKYDESPLTQASHILHPGGIAALDALGLRSALDGVETFPVHGYTVYRHTESANVFFSLPSKKDGWPEKKTNAVFGVAFRRERLARKLRRMAGSQRSVLVVAATVTQIVRGGMSGEIMGVECFREQEQNPVHYLADLTLLCDGPNSTLRSDLSTTSKPATAVLRPDPPNRFWAFDIAYGALPVEEMACSIIDAAGCNITLFRVSRDTLRAHIEMTPALASTLNTHRDTNLRQYILAHVVPLIPEPAHASFRRAAASVRLEPISLGLRCAKAHCHPGVVLLHDQPNTTDITVDSGMMVAFKDVELLVSLVGATHCGVLHCRSLANSWRTRLALAKFSLKRKKHTAPLDMVARVLGKWGDSRDVTHDILRRSIITFLARGSATYHAPMQSLAGLLKRRRRLARPLTRLACCAVSESLAAVHGLQLVVAWFRVMGIVWLACQLAVEALIEDILR